MVNGKRISTKSLKQGTNEGMNLQIEKRTKLKKQALIE
jgi:hypothetical protein